MSKEDETEPGAPSETQSFTEWHGPFEGGEEDEVLVDGQRREQHVVLRGHCVNTNHAHTPHDEHSPSDTVRQ